MWLRTAAARYVSLQGLRSNGHNAPSQLICSPVGVTREAPMRHAMSQEDLSFARAFEACKVSPEAFDHAAHVRLAYIYLCQHSVEESVVHMKDALLAFLTHLGVSHTKYHETITRSWIMAVAHFMNESAPCESAAAFIASNPRLLDSKIMLTHYTAEVLFSPQARDAFVRPNRRPIPEH